MISRLDISSPWDSFRLACLRSPEHIVNLFCPMLDQMAVHYELLTLPAYLVDLFPILWIQCFFNTRLQVLRTDREVMYAITKSQTGKRILDPFLSQQKGSG